MIRRAHIGRSPVGNQQSGHASTKEHDIVGQCSSSRGAAASNWRLGSCMRTFAYALYDVTLREAPPPSVTVLRHVQERQQLVEARIRTRSKGHHLVQRLE